MILELYMKNCALVEELRLGIDENLNILTGETGSGKSIIIDALGLCLGEKYDRSFLEYVDELPKTIGGKIKRKLIRQTDGIQE